MRISTTIAGLLLLTSVVSCNKTPDPKDVSVTFIESLNRRDFGTALSLATPDTKEFVAQLKNDQQVNTRLAKDSGQDVHTIFVLDSLKPFLSGNSAIVKNEVVAINLARIDGDWRVVANPETVTAILYRSERLGEAKLAWEALVAEYNKRTEILKEYLAYINGNGRSSAESQNLEAALGKLPVLNGPLTKENLAAYVQAQEALDALADKAVQPALNASADLTMNYIIRLGEQAARIRDAKAAYNKAAGVAQSGVYVAVK